MAKKGFWDYALTSGISTGIGKKKNNGPQAPQFQPYSGLRPPRVNYNPVNESPVASPGNILRPVQQTITDTLLRRSQGKDVGFDPARRDELQKNFDIQQGRDLENSTADIKNRLAGQGLSHNAAATDDLLGRALRNANQEKNLYTNRIDIEDMAKRNEDTTHATDQLQGLNATNFGQENQAANFDLGVYNAENQGKHQNFQDQNAAYGNYQDPLGTALALAGQGAGLYADIQSGGAYSAIKNGVNASPSAPTPVYDPSSIRSNGQNYNAGIYNDPLAAALRGQGTGKNLLV